MAFKQAGWSPFTKPNDDKKYPTGRLHRKLDELDFKKSTTDNDYIPQTVNPKEDITPQTQRGKSPLTKNGLDRTLLEEEEEEKVVEEYPTNRMTSRQAWEQEQKRRLEGDTNVGPVDIPERPQRITSESSMPKTVSSPMKYDDDPWGVGADRRKKDRRYNPSSSDLRGNIKLGAELLSRYKREAEESGKMGDWKKYNDKLAEFKDFDTYFSGYSDTLKDRTVRDSVALEEGDIGELEDYMKYRTEGYEPKSSPTLDKMTEWEARGKEAKAKGDTEALQALAAEMRQFKSVKEAMESGVSPEEYAKQQQLKRGKATGGSGQI